MTRAGICILVLLLISFGPATQTSFAQVNAIVGGTVSDSSGALIPGVEVTARNIATGIVTTRITNESGNYDFASLQPGVYGIRSSSTSRIFSRTAFSRRSTSHGPVVTRRCSTGFSTALTLPAWAR